MAGLLRLGNRDVVRFLRVAEMHEEATRELAKTLKQGGASRVATVATYLAGYVVECCLKAWLLSATPAAKQNAILSQFRGTKGHDLVWLRSELAQRHVNIPSPIVDMIRRVASYWSPDLRYDPAHAKHDLAIIIMNSSTGLLDWLRT